MSSLKYWIWLSSVSGIGPVTALQLLDHFGTPENVFLADLHEYRKMESGRSVDFSQLMRKDLDDSNKILSSCQKVGCRIVTLHDAEYPDRLRNIYDPPLVLYVRGNLPSIDDEAAVAIVGTRDCTLYGITSAENIGYSLAQRGLLVVTGLARGIDSAAARGALRGGGCVLGVIGTGVDIVYPLENASLFENVSAYGAIISEYPPGTPAIRAHFPARNRIISGLSLGVAVIEAPKRSGALITAAKALEQGRDVFVLPGNIDAKSCEGSNSLLREGAIPILSGEDIINEYSELFPDKIVPDGQVKKISHEKKDAERLENPRREDNYTQNNDKKVIDKKTTLDYIDINAILSELTGDEKKVAETIGEKTIHVDEIIAGSGLTVPQVLTALTMLEINGHVLRAGNGKWKII